MSVIFLAILGYHVTVEPFSQHFLSGAAQVGGIERDGSGCAAGDVGRVLVAVRTGVNGLLLMLTKNAADVNGRAQHVVWVGHGRRDGRG